MSPQLTATMLTSLLTSLHTHLQTQTQLLPTLYAQLGLPTTALEDELKALQQQLVEKIEVQIDKRRKEVDEWMEKCEALENQCTRYTKALGANIKATGTSLGELRKEQALPHRYDMISEYQEKLRQVYHTKLEQLMAITNRLHALTRTLGSDYFSMDVMEPAVLTGEDPLDPNATKDVTPERFLRMEKELVRGKADITKRLNQLSVTFTQIDWLYAELGMVVPQPEEGLSSPGIVSSRDTPSSDPFTISTPTPPPRNTSSHTSNSTQNEFEFRRILCNFIAKLDGVEPEDIPDTPVPYGLEGVEPTPALLTWASQLCSALEETKRRREGRIQAMYDQLEILWRRMGVPDEAMDAFVENNRGSTEETVQRYEEELERMLELKKERMGAFVENAREEITRLWDELMVADDEKADFAPFVDDEFTEELLTIHEDEIKRLKEEKRLKAPILASVKKYFDICNEEKELAAAASDQSRLTGRGQRGDPGRLLREEKMRKRVQKEKPRLEKELLASIPAWEEANGTVFLMRGESILQILLETIATTEESKKRTTRAASVPLRQPTPVNNAPPKRPSTRAGSVTPAVRPRSQASNYPASNKRQKLAEGSYATASSSTQPPAPPATSRRPLSSQRHGNSTRSAKPSSKSLSRQPTIEMVVPKPGTQQHSLGHGRLPTSVIYGPGVGGSVTRSASTRFAHANQQSKANPATTAKRVVKAQRESFKPRPSIDVVEQRAAVASASSGKWGGGFTVTEE